MKAETTQLKITPIVFEGVNSSQTLHSTPDSDGGVDYRYFVEFINGAYAIFDKSNGSLVNRVTDVEFWERAGITSGTYVVDPRIIFIPDAGRHGQWLAVQLKFGSTIRVATTNPVSGLADPSIGNWKGAEFNLPGNDFTMLGYDAKGIYIGSNTATRDLTEEEKSGEKEVEAGRQTQIVFIPREKALAYPPQVGPNDITITPLLDPREYGTGLFPTVDQSGAGWPYQTFIGFDNITKRHITWALFSPEQRVILSHAKIEVEPFTPIFHGSRVRQPQDQRGQWVMYGVDQCGSAPYNDGFNIWLTQTVYTGAPAQSAMAVRWYRLYIDPVTRMPGLAKQGLISDLRGELDYYNPSIISFGKDDYTVISCSRSGTTTNDPNNPDCGNIGAYAAIFKESGPNSATQIVPLRAGQCDLFKREQPLNWGDYSTICRDPDQKRFPRRVWTVNQYVTGRNGTPTTSWGTAIAALDLPSI